MSRFYSRGNYEELSFARAKELDLTWDVFVSHKSEDKSTANHVADCIRESGLTAWVDSDHLEPNDDGPEMASKISGIIERSYCLMAVVTSATKESWWVPFEIGIASDMNRFLSTYGDPKLELPSFLIAWPRVKDHDELHDWCKEIKSKKRNYSASEDRGIVVLSNAQRSQYTEEMKQMLSKFRGS